MKYLVRVYPNKDKNPESYKEKVVDNRKEIYELLRIQNSTFSKFMNGELDMNNTQFPWLRNVEVSKIKDIDKKTSTQKKNEMIFQEILDSFDN